MKSLTLCALLGASLLGCSDATDAVDTVPDATTDPGGAAVADATSLPDGAAVAPDASTDVPPAPPALFDDPDEPWCARLSPGPANPQAPWLGLSRAHASRRFFGAPSGLGFAEIDGALVDALAPTGFALADALRHYAAALSDVCGGEADRSGLPPGEVADEDGVLWIRPGSEMPAIPTSGLPLAYVVDLRDLPEAPGLAQTLDLVALALHTSSEAPTPLEKVRRHHGLRDELWSPTNLYVSTLVTRVAEPLAGNSRAALRPVAILIGERISPSAAHFAVRMRVSERAYLVGEALPVALAESHWVGAGDHGLAVRVRELVDPKGERLPDLLAADHPLSALEDLLGWPPRPPPISGGSTERAALAPIDPWEASPAIGLDRGITRAALVIVHGALDRFFPYFDIVGDGLHDRFALLMDETEASVPSDRPAMADLLRRLLWTIHDGHAFVFDQVSPSSGIPVVLDHLAGRPIIRRALPAHDLAPGDTIVAIDGTPVEAWYHARRELVSAASEGYALDLIGRRVGRFSGTRTFTLEDPEGRTREVSLTPLPAADPAWSAFDYSYTPRPSGRLTDLGAPGVLYLNLDGQVTPDAAAIAPHLDDIGAAEAVVADMRGYPAAFQTEVVNALSGGAYQSPLFDIPVWEGPDDFSFFTQQHISGQPTPIGKPIVWLVSPRSVSAAENLSTSVVTLTDAHVMGRPSAATNGNITGVSLPGGFGATFTGMLVSFPDGSTFHGVGIVPDTVVAPTAADLRDGVDTVLEAALDHLDAR